MVEPIEDLRELLLRELRTEVRARIECGEPPCGVLADLNRRARVMSEMRRTREPDDDAEAFT